MIDNQMFKSTGIGFVTGEMGTMGKMFPLGIPDTDQRINARAPKPHRKFPVPARYGLSKKGKNR